MLRPGRIEAAYFFVHIDGTFFCPRHEHLILRLQFLGLMVLDSSKNTWTSLLFVVSSNRNVLGSCFASFSRDAGNHPLLSWWLCYFTICMILIIKGYMYFKIFPCAGCLTSIFVQ